MVNVSMFSDCSPISHDDQQQWKSLNLRLLFTDLSNPIGIIGDKGFFFNPIDLIRKGASFIIGYKPRRKSEKSMKYDIHHNKVVAQLRIVVENFICQMKKFKCISKVFRHYCSKTYQLQTKSMEFLSKVVKIVAYLSNLMKNPRANHWKPRRKKDIPKNFIVLPDNYEYVLNVSDSRKSTIIKFT